MSRYEADIQDEMPRPRRSETLPARLDAGAPTAPNSLGNMTQRPPSWRDLQNLPQNPYFGSMNTAGAPPPGLLPAYYFPPSMYYMGARPETITMDSNLHRFYNNAIPLSQIAEDGVSHHSARVAGAGRLVERDHERDRIRVRRRTSTYQPSHFSDSADESSEEWSEEARHRRSSLPVHMIIRDNIENYNSIAYSFTPSRMSPSLTTQDSHTADEETSEHTEAEIGQQKGRHHSRTTHVFESKYTGDRYLGGFHAAELNTVTSTKTQYQPLFRWVHLKQSSMSFDDFLTEASSIPNLTKTERTAITTILSRVKRKFVKSIQTLNGGTVQKMEPACIQHELPSGGSFKGQSFTPRTVTWICLPYFSLEPYSGLLSATKPSEFPIQTILQAQFSRATQERDMQQAVCQNKNGPAGLCFHISQLWCLVLDNALLLTCSRVTEDTLFADSISKTLNTTQESPEAVNPAQLSVCYQGSVMWSIPVAECQTWLGFLSHFKEFWPQPIVFFRNRRQVTAEEWPKIWHLARRVHTRITLDLKFETQPSPPPRGRLALPKLTEKVESRTQSEPETQSKGSTEESERINLERKSTPRSHPNSTTSPPVFSLFTCLDGVTRADLDVMDQTALENHMSEIEDYLLRMTSVSDRRAYRECAEISRESVQTLLERQESDISESAKAQSTQQRDYEERIDIFNAADVIFSFFFPIHIIVPTVNKFWGAVKALVEKPPVDDSKSHPSQFNTNRVVHVVRERLRNMTTTLILFSNIFNHSQKADRVSVQVPVELVQAWIHLVMGLVFAQGNLYKSEMLIDNAEVLIDEGFNKIVNATSKKSLLESSAVLPMEIVSLMSLNLLHDITPGLPDISKTYSSYLSSIESDIATKVSDRSHEQRIRLLKQEISIIIKTMDSQRSVFHSLLSHSRSLRSSTVIPADRLESGRTIQPRTQSYAHHEPQTSMSAPYGYSGRDESHKYSSSAPNGYSGRDESYNYSSTYPTIASSTADFKLAPTDPGGFRDLLLQECLLELDRRRREFSEFSLQAYMLEEVNRNKVDTTKDRQELAIYAFTIVTIIFLPLSFVASIFGMNTNDVRNMELDQWAYWAVAVPVTIIVIFLGLLWTGELGNILRWVTSFGPKTKGQNATADDGYLHNNYRVAGTPGWPRSRINPPATLPYAGHPFNPYAPGNRMHYPVNYEEYERYERPRGFF